MSAEDQIDETDKTDKTDKTDGTIAYASLREATVRGLCRRCPHCGRGPLFRTWFKLHERCSVCDFKYERNHGDTWAFWLLGDRVFVVALLALIYFGFRSYTWHIAVGVFLVFLIPLIWTMPNRMGVCIGLDYMSRVRFGQPDEIPPMPRDE